MAGPTILPQNQTLRLIAQANKREFSLFLGAGASKSSGVPLAGEMIAEWRRMIFEDRARPGDELEAWCREQPWFEKDEEYSVLFETLFPNERARQQFVEPKIEAGFPSWCYLYLANMVGEGYFNVIFTTNFDDLVHDALTIYRGYNPVVCAADSEVQSINIATDRAKIIKLHGDYLFRRLKNTVEELNELDPNMEAKFCEFAKQCGMVVLGYAGRDRSVMSVLAELLKDELSFPAGLYWGLRPGEAPHRRVRELAAAHPKRFHLFESTDFDTFMAGLHTRLGLSLPQTVLQPYEALRDRFEKLVKRAEEVAAIEPSTLEHIRELEEQLNRPWAKTSDTTRFDLLEAQLALGRRAYREAVELATSYCAKHPEDAAGFTVWGDALAQLADEEGSKEAGLEAIERWRSAIRLAPASLPARYSLARFCVREKRTADAIEACEEIAKLAPADTMMRRNLVQLYYSNGRSNDALRELAELEKREPQAADLHFMRAHVYEQRGLIDLTLKSAGEAVRLDGGNAMMRFFLGLQLLRRGRVEEGLRECERAIELDPRNLGFRLQSAEQYAGRGRFPQALHHMEEAARIEPDSAEVRGWLAQLYLYLNRLDEARRQVQEAIRLSPEDGRTLGLAGIILLRLGSFEEAERYLTDSIRLNDTAPQPLFYMSIVHWALGRQWQLNDTLQRLAQLAPPAYQQLATMLQMWQQMTYGDLTHRRALVQAQLGMVGQQPQPANLPAPPVASPSWIPLGNDVDLAKLHEQNSKGVLSRILGHWPPG